MANYVAPNETNPDGNELSRRAFIRATLAGGIALAAGGTSLMFGAETPAGAGATFTMQIPLHTADSAHTDE